MANSIISIVVAPNNTSRLFRLCGGLMLCGMVAFLHSYTQAQTSPATSARWPGHLVWVLPFENNSAQPGVDWIGESFPYIVNQRLSSAGFLTIRREDRRYALQHLGLPADFRPTQATAYRIAQTLDADFVVFGNYTVANGQLTATARVLEMHAPRISPALEEHGPLNQLIQIENGLAWKIAMKVDPSLNLEEQTFLAAGRGLRLDALENYIRGEVEPGPDERIGHLQKAVQISPNYTQAWFALGKAYFADQQFDQAEAAFDKVPKDDRLSLEARFYAGLSNLYTGGYAPAQAKFASIAAVLPMPEVLNNEGIAVNRRGENGTAFFQRVVQLNPQNEDYWFNLAVSQRRQKDYTDALRAVAKALTLSPKDPEAQNLRQNLLMLKDGTVVSVSQQGSSAKKNETADSAPDDTNANASAPNSAPSASASSSSDAAAGVPGKSAQAAEPSAGASTGPESADYEPLERIARTYDESSLRQAAFAMEQMNAMNLHSLPPEERARKLCEQGDAYVGDGLLLEAERQFQLALDADPKSASAYAGLAQVHEYAGSVEIATREANTSLQMRPNVNAYLVLARIALGQRAFAAAQENAEQALRLQPNDTAAKGILQAIQAQQSR